MRRGTKKLRVNGDRMRWKKVHEENGGLGRMGGGGGMGMKAEGGWCVEPGDERQHKKTGREMKETRRRLLGMEKIEIENCWDSCLTRV